MCRWAPSDSNMLPARVQTVVYFRMFFGKLYLPGQSWKMHHDIDQLSSAKNQAKIPRFWKNWSGRVNWQGVWQDDWRYQRHQRQSHRQFQAICKVLSSKRRRVAVFKLSWNRVHRWWDLFGLAFTKTITLQKNKFWRLLGRNEVKA
jgi:hypothetical protein